MPDNSVSGASDKGAHWALDKRVPIALILSIVLQTGGIIWWASDVNARVSQLERQAVATGPQSERIIRLETQIEAIREGIAEIKVLVRRERTEAR
jgi:hypothetical protein